MSSSWCVVLNNVSQLDNVKACTHFPINAFHAKCALPTHTCTCTCTRTCTRTETNIHTVCTHTDSFILWNGKWRSQLADIYKHSKVFSLGTPRETPKCLVICACWHGVDSRTPLMKCLPFLLTMFPGYSPLRYDVDSGNGKLFLKGTSPSLKKGCCTLHYLCCVHVT